jgi:hypothetical protein
MLINERPIEAVSYKPWGYDWIGRVPQGMRDMRKTMKNFLNRGVLLAAAFVAASGAAQATVVDSGSNNPLAFSWSYDTGSSLLTGSGSMTVSGFNSTSLTLSVSLTNTSLIGGIGGERLTAFGFGIDPNATAVTFSDSADAGMINAALGSIPSISTVEVCAYGGSNCSGGSDGGIYGAGGSDTFSILLSGTWGSSVDIAPIGFKYQTGYGSFEFTSSTSTTSTTTSSSGAAPEPGSGALLLLGLGLLVVGFALRRKQQLLSA